MKNLEMRQQSANGIGKMLSEAWKHGATEKIFAACIDRASLDLDRMGAAAFR